RKEGPQKTGDEWPLFASAVAYPWLRPVFSGFVHAPVPLSSPAQKNRSETNVRKVQWFGNEIWADPVKFRGVFCCLSFYIDRLLYSLCPLNLIGTSRG